MADLGGFVDGVLISSISPTVNHCEIHQPNSHTEIVGKPAVTLRRYDSVWLILIDCDFWFQDDMRTNHSHICKADCRFGLESKPNQISLNTTRQYQTISLVLFRLQICNLQPCKRKPSVCNLKTRTAVCCSAAQLCKNPWPQRMQTAELKLLTCWSNWWLCNSCNAGALRWWLQQHTHGLLGMNEGPVDLDLKVPRDARVLDLREANVLRKT